MRRALLAAASLVLLGLPAAAGVDAEVPPAIKAKGTVLPEGEVETYRFFAAAGSSLTVTASPAKGSTLQLAAALDDPLGAPVSLPAAVAGKVAARGVILPLSGSYELRLSGTGTGEYGLALTAKAAKKSGATVALGASATGAFAFSAPPGSAVTLVAKAAKGSGAVPRFGNLTGDAYAVDLSAAGKVSPAGHVVKVLPVGGTGDLSVEVVNGAAVAGDVLVSAVVKAPKTKRAKLDLRGATLGMPAGGETVFSRIVGAAGGVVAVADPSSDLDGAAVDVPAGAFEAPTVVTIASSAPVVDPTDDVRQSSGPAVDLGPSGTVFGDAVLVTLPYDLAAVPADASPQDLKVLVREDDGTTLTVNPMAVDETAGTVTVQVTGFSVCVPISVPGISRIGLEPGGDPYWVLIQDASLGTDAGGDSRARDFGMEVGEVSFYGDSTFQYSLEERRISWSDGGNGTTFNSEALADVGGGTFSYGADGQTVVLDTGSGTPLSMVTTRDARYMAGREGDPARTGASNYLFLRKNADPVDASSFDGTWSAVGLEVSFNGYGSSGPMGMGMHRFQGSLTFDGEGGFRFAIVDRKHEFDGTTGSWGLQGESQGGSGTYAVQGDGTAILSIPPEDPGDQGDSLRVFPGEGLETLVVVDDQPCGDCTFYIVLVRQSSGFDRSAVAGDYRALLFQYEPESYGAVSGQVADVSLSEEDASVVFSSNGTATVSIDDHGVRRDTLATGGVAVDNGTENLDVSWSVDAKGKFAFTVPGESPPSGFLVPSGDFGALGIPPSSASGDYTAGFLLKPPPKKN
jgi:hypothetical protein